MTWAAPLAFGWMGLALLVLLFYLLRPKRQQIVVASLWLWQRTLRHERDKSWLDWLKRHLLLILQLVTVLVLVLALARPERQTNQVLGPPVGLVIDASLSMQLEDVAPNRLEAAKALALDFVRRLPPDARITVIEAGGTLRPILIDSTDRVAVESAIEGVQVSVASGRVSAALDMALSLAPRADGGMVALFSDGSFELAADTAYLSVRSFSVGGGAANVALETFAVRLVDRISTVQALIGVRNYGTQPVDVTITLRGAEPDPTTATLRVPARARENLVLEGLGVAAGYAAEIGAPGDALPQDNLAFAELDQAHELRVLVSGEEPEPIVRAIQALPGVQAAGASVAEYARIDAHDIYVFQGWAPATLPRASVVLVRPPAGNPLGLTAYDAHASLPLAAAESPLLRFLDPLEITSGRDLQYDIPAWAQADLAADGQSTLVHGVLDGRRVVVLGLDLTAPDATLAPWYPVLWNNVIEWANPDDPLPAPGPLRPGTPVVLVPHPAAQRVEIVLPNGNQSTHDTLGPVILETDAVGAYVIRQFDAERLLVQTRVAVEPRPGAGAPEPRVVLPGSTVVSRASGEASSTVELWPWLAVLAIALLTAEWWWFHRVRGLR